MIGEVGEMITTMVLNHDLHFELGIFDIYCQSVTGSLGSFLSGGPKSTPRTPGVVPIVRRWKKYKEDKMKNGGTICLFRKPKTSNTRGYC